MRRVLVPLAIVAVTLAGCATVAPMDSTDAPIRYSCKAGKRFTAGGAEIWSKGADAMLSGFPGGPYDGCHSQ